MSQPAPGHTVTDEQGRRYRLGPELGCGAQASVFEAVGPQGERVAIKLFKASPSRASDLQRAEALMRHAQQRQLSLPAALPLAMVRDAAAQGYVTTLVPDAHQLEALIESGQIAYFAGFQVVAALWEALAQLHEAGIAHGDLRSRNILVNANGLTLIDLDNFVLPGQPGLPPPPFVGDLEVMAPELRQRVLQRQPAAQLVGLATDVYAANALTYLMLVGDDDNMGAVGLDALHRAKLSGRWNGDPLAGGQAGNLNPRMLPVSLMSLIRQAWQGDPALRPSAREFARLLGQVLAERTLFSCPHCGQAVFADALLRDCPHCQQPMPVPVLQGPGVRVPVAQGALTVGRAELGGDPSISSRHAVLQRMGPMLRFTDRSSFGTSHRDRGQGWEHIPPSSAVVLVPGDRLRLGRTEFQVAHG
ncbi:protein kinase [Ideonella sp. 4Y16]|uniref:protein kinase domain-containing protein n=1 Tax=Ideonella alba TaxID=2824118 RepID=UPI001B380272|nr:protein kinase [Ideonella alba]MBQ0942255.1 protein kinase [Ideonella alba]